MVVVELPPLPVDMNFAISKDKFFKMFHFVVVCSIYDNIHWKEKYNCSPILSLKTMTTSIAETWKSFCLEHHKQKMSKHPTAIVVRFSVETNEK